MIRTPAAVSLALVLTACGVQTATVEPGSGPATSSTSPSSTASTSSTTSATFGQKFTYPDGVEVEVTKIETAKTDAYALIGDDEVDKGTAYTRFSVRIRNGSRETLDSIGTTELHYGADGDEADAVYDGSTVPQLAEGKTPPGKAKTGRYGYLVPKKGRSDVQFEVTVDFEHDAVVFTGSL